MGAQTSHRRSPGWAPWPLTGRLRECGIFARTGKFTSCALDKRERVNDNLAHIP